jgi:hypothetical protein
MGKDQQDLNAMSAEACTFDHSYPVENLGDHVGIVRDGLQRLPLGSVTEFLTFVWEFNLVPTLLTLANHFHHYCSQLACCFCSTWF